MRGIDGGYKLSELLSDRGGSADAVVNVTPFYTHSYATGLFVVITTEWKEIVSKY